MEFTLKILLNFLVFLFGLVVFLQGKRGTLVASLGIGLIALARGLSGLVLSAAALIPIISYFLEGRIQSWVKGQSKGALFSGLAGSLVILLFYGIFLGPMASLIAWLITSGLQLLPQLSTRVGKLRYWGNSFYRLALSLATLSLGFYTVYK